MRNARSFLRKLPCSIFALWLPLLLGSRVVTGQEPSAPQVQLSPDGEAFIRAASPYGLADPLGTPLHLRISFDLLDTQGSPRQHFTFEQFVRNRTSYKAIFETTGFRQVQYYVGPGGVRVTGDDKMPDGLFFMVRSAIISPINPALLTLITRNPSQFDISSENRTIAGEDVRCFSVAFKMAPNSTPSTDCFNDKNALTSYKTQLGSMATANNTVTFNDRVFPRDILTSDPHLPIRAHLELIEPLADSNDALFESPDDAQPLNTAVAGFIRGGDAPPLPGTSAPPSRVNISAGVAAGMLIKHDPPQYPPDALAARISGTVVLQVAIGKDGHIIDLHVVSGPARLSQAAMDAVKNWEYRPYLLNGQPVEVVTTVAVPFISDRP